LRDPDTRVSSVAELLAGLWSKMAALTLAVLLIVVFPRAVTSTTI
jgi:uncharacterized membrane protein